MQVFDDCAFPHFHYSWHGQGKCCPHLEVQWENHCLIVAPSTHRCSPKSWRASFVTEKQYKAHTFAVCYKVTELRTLGDAGRLKTLVCTATFSWTFIFNVQLYFSYFTAKALKCLANLCKTINYYSFTQEDAFYQVLAQSSALCLGKALRFFTSLSDCFSWKGQGLVSSKLCCLPLGNGFPQDASTQGNCLSRNGIQELLKLKAGVNKLKLQQDKTQDFWSFEKQNRE